MPQFVFSPLLKFPREERVTNKTKQPLDPTTNKQKKNMSQQQYYEGPPPQGAYTPQPMYYPPQGQQQYPVEPVRQAPPQKDRGFIAGM